MARVLLLFLRKTSLIKTIAFHTIIALLTISILAPTFLSLLETETETVWVWDGAEEDNNNKKETEKEVEKKELFVEFFFAQLHAETNSSGASNVFYLLKNLDRAEPTPFRPPKNHILA